MNEKRNWKIYFEWIDGKTYNELAAEFSLAHSTIKEICKSHVPAKVRQIPWQTANEYKKWRAFLKSQRLQSVNNGSEVSKERTDAVLSSPLTLQGTR